MKHDVSNIIKQANEMGISNRRIAKASGVGRSTVSRAAKEGYLVGEKIRFAINAGVNVLQFTAHLPANHWMNKPFSPDFSALMLEPMKTTPTATLAANLEKQVEQLRDTINGSGLVDDAIESAHSREKAELQKALAARISEVQAEREKNATQYESIGQCFAEIKRLQDELNHQKLITASRNADLAVYQKALETTDNRADDAEYKAAEFERDLTVQRAWTWFFVLLAFVAAVVGVVK